MQKHLRATYSHDGPYSSLAIRSNELKRIGGFLHEIFFWEAPATLMAPVCVLVPTGTYFAALKLSSEKYNLNNVSVCNVPKINKS